MSMLLTARTYWVLDPTDLVVKGSGVPHLSSEVGATFVIRYEALCGTLFDNLGGWDAYISVAMLHPF